jgi:hypothetical protein
VSRDVRSNVAPTTSASVTWELFCERHTGCLMGTLTRFILDVLYQPGAPILNKLAAPVVS